jgi:hypothetical protein
MQFGNAFRVLGGFWNLNTRGKLLIPIRHLFTEMHKLAPGFQKPPLCGTKRGCTGQNWNFSDLDCNARTRWYRSHNHLAEENGALREEAEPGLWRYRIRLTI